MHSGSLIKGLIAVTLMSGAVTGVFAEPVSSATGLPITSSSLNSLVVTSSVSRQQAVEVAELLEGINADFHEIRSSLEQQPEANLKGKQLEQAQLWLDSAVTTLNLYGVSGQQQALQDFNESYGNFVGWLNGFVEREIAALTDEEMKLKVLYLQDDLQWVNESAATLLVSNS